MTDFLIGRDKDKQRYAYPVSEAGRAYFEVHAGDFDASELGWELDTTATAYDEFVAAMSENFLTFTADFLQVGDRVLYEGREYMVEGTARYVNIGPRYFQKRARGVKVRPVEGGRAKVVQEAFCTLQAAREGT